MNDKTKIQFSEAELALINDREIILTKRAVAEKVYSYLVLIQEEINIHLKEEIPGLPDLLKYAIPKITKGENYNAFPFFVLDYPSVFNKESILAIRTIIIWGDCISTQLLCTNHNEAAFKKIAQNLHYTRDEALYVCVNESPWLHEFTDLNYKRLSDIHPNLNNKDFIKVAYRYPLDQLQKGTAEILVGIKKLINLLGEDLTT